MKRQASFSFEKYRISEFSFKESVANYENLSVGFDPHGIYDENNAQFDLILNFKAFLTDVQGSKNEENIIIVKLVSTYKFEENTSYKDIPEYFYRNSIAITFPYLRAFVSTLTLLANLKVLNLPVMNLSDLEKPLKENTTFISREQ